MKTREEIRSIIKGHKKDLHVLFHVSRIGLFGSLARNEGGGESDIDILVEFDKSIGWEIVDLHRYLEQILEMKVDLVTKGAVKRKPLLWQSIQEDLIYV